MAKRIAWIGLGLIATVIVGLAIAGQKTQEIRTEIEIAAPRAKVWAVLSDINSWSKWSPIIKTATGTAALGAELDVTMVGKDDEPGPQYKPVITELEVSKKLRWRAHMGAEFLFTNDKILELEETAQGTTFVHRELFRGMLAPVFCTQMEEGVPPMLNAMNLALKTKVESE